MYFFLPKLLGIGGEYFRICLCLYSCWFWVRFRPDTTDPVHVHSLACEQFLQLKLLNCYGQKIWRMEELNILIGSMKKKLV